MLNWSGRKLRTTRIGCWRLVEGGATNLELSRLGRIYPLYLAERVEQHLQPGINGSTVNFFFRNTIARPGCLVVCVHVERSVHGLDDVAVGGIQAATAVERGKEQGEVLDGLHAVCKLVWNGGTSWMGQDPLAKILQVSQQPGSSVMAHQHLFQVGTYEG